MKSIELKTTIEQVFISGVKKEYEFSTLELIKTAANNCPPGGFAASDMMSRLRIIDAVESCEKQGSPADVINLEDNDYENLKKYVETTKWNVLSRSIVDFIKSFSSTK